MFSDLRGNDIIDVRELLRRQEELESQLEDFDPETDDADDRVAVVEELNAVREVLEEIEGCGQEEIRGVMYPDQLISRDYWPKYVQMQAAELYGYDAKTIAWPANHIDWDAAADDFEESYSTCTFGGEEYLYRD